MGWILIVGRLALRDLRRRRAEAGLLLLAMMAATTTLALGLNMYETVSEPYQNTREATAGPDVIASLGPPLEGIDHLVPADVASLEALTDAPGVVGHSGPYPMIGAELEAGGDRTAEAWVQGRSTTADASLDQPELIEGNWVSDGGVVVEAGLASALGVGGGDQINVDGRSFQVVGVAVTAATSPYPHVCFVRCGFGAWERPPLLEVGSEPSPEDEPELLFEPEEIPLALQVSPGNSGLVWATDADVRGLAPQADYLSYFMNLKLADPADAPTFVSTHMTGRGPNLATWQDILDHHTNTVQNQQIMLVGGSWMVGILAVASVAVLVGGRMADQTRRVGLLKAVGGTPSLVAIVLLAEYVIVALLAAAGGLAAAWLGAPLLADTTALVGSAGGPALTLSTVGLVTAMALGVAVLATFVPAIRAARTSTVSALADTARPPRRTAWLVALSARLPVPLLLGLRLAARRPRRLVLGAASIAITVSGLVFALAGRAQLSSSVVDEAELEAASKTLLAITVMLVALAAVNTIFITWATALDARHSSALARAVGATPREVSAGLSAAQVLPALTGAVLGIPLGLLLYVAVLAAEGEETPIPPLWWLLALVVGTVLVVAVLTAIPARLGARRPVAQTLQAELA